MKKIIVILSLIVITGLAYLQVTDITFSENRGHISALYCRLFAKDQPKAPVIFIPGIKGSTLNRNGKTLWLTLKQSLFNSEPLIYDKNQNVSSDGIYARTVIIPYIYEYRPYYLTASQLSCSDKAYFYYYDWRNNPTENAENLKKLIDQVTRETNTKPNIMSHSMGGLLARYIAVKYPETIDKVAYVGTPFYPGIGFMADIINGSETGLNKTILDKSAVISHYSSFALLPHQGSKLYNGLDVLDQKNWENTLYKAENITTPSLSTILNEIQEANNFLKQLEAPQTHNLDSFYIYSDCKPTPYEIKDNLTIEQPGDGRVIAQGAIANIKTNEKYETYTTCVSHDQEFNNAEIYQKIISFFNQ